MEAILNWHAMAPLVIALLASLIAGLALFWFVSWLNRPRPIVLPDGDEEDNYDDAPPVRRQHTPAPTERQTPPPRAAPVPGPKPAVAPAPAAEPASSRPAPTPLAAPARGAQVPNDSLALQTYIRNQARYVQRVERHDFSSGPLILFFRWRAALGRDPIPVPFCFMPDHTGDNRRKAIEWLHVVTSTSRVLVDVLEFTPKDRMMVDLWRDFLDWMFKAGDDLKRWMHPTVSPFLYLWILRDQLGLGISDGTMALIGRDTVAFSGNADLLGVLQMEGARPTATAQYAALSAAGEAEPEPTAPEESSEPPAATPPASEPSALAEPAPRVTAELAALDPSSPTDQ